MLVEILYCGEPSNVTINICQKVINIYDLSKKVNENTFIFLVSLDLIRNAQSRMGLVRDREGLVTVDPVWSGKVCLGPI